MKITKLGSRNIMFTFDTSTEWDLNLTLILGNKYNFIVDPGLGSHTLDPMVQYANENHPRPFIIINTHYHWDHTWANSCLKDSIIIAHEKCGEIINQNWDEAIERNAEYIVSPVEKVLPNLTFDNVLEFPEEGIKLIHTPGHSPDSISVIDTRDSVINMGDNIGDTLEAIVPYLECEKSIYRESLDKCKASGCHTIISGHNIVLGIEILDTILEAL